MINKNKESFCRFCGEHERNTKGQGPRVPLLPKTSKGFAVFVDMSINVLWFDVFVEILTYEKSFFFLVGPVEYSSSNSFE